LEAVKLKIPVFVWGRLDRGHDNCDGETDEAALRGEALGRRRDSGASAKLLTRA
jgi:hypothetical protein